MTSTIRRYMIWFKMEIVIIRNLKKMYNNLRSNYWKMRASG